MQIEPKGVLPEKRAEWRRWAEEQFGSDDDLVDVATEAVLDGLIRGLTVDDAMTEARDAVRAHSTHFESHEAVSSEFRSDSTHLRGRVASFRERSELMGKQYGSVWNFRVDQVDERGAVIGSVAVEMRGTSFSGSVGDGDWVEIPGGWRSGTIMQADLVRNVTQNSTVTTHGGGLPNRFLRVLGALVQTVIIFIVLAGIAVAAYLVWRGFR